MAAALVTAGWAAGASRVWSPKLADAPAFDWLGDIYTAPFGDVVETSGSGLDWDCGNFSGSVGDAEVPGCASQSDIPLAAALEPGLGMYWGGDSSGPGTTVVSGSMGFGADGGDGYWEAWSPIVNSAVSAPGSWEEFSPTTVAGPLGSGYNDGSLVPYAGALTGSGDGMVIQSQGGLTDAAGSGATCAWLDFSGGTVGSSAPVWVLELGDNAYGGPGVVLYVQGGDLFLGYTNTQNGSWDDSWEGQIIAAAEEQGTANLGAVTAGQWNMYCVDELQGSDLAAAETLSPVGAQEDLAAPSGYSAVEVWVDGGLGLGSSQFDSCDGCNYMVAMPESWVPDSARWNVEGGSAIWGMLDTLDAVNFAVGAFNGTGDTLAGSSWDSNTFCPSMPDNTLTPTCYQYVGMSWPGIFYETADILVGGGLNGTGGSGVTSGGGTGGSAGNQNPHCSPLTGDYSKPCLNLQVGQLTVFSPSWNLGADVAWMAAWVWSGMENVVEWVVNGLIDVIIPGSDALTQWENLGVAFSDHAPFCWVGGIFTSLGDMFSAPATSPTWSVNVDPGVAGSTYTVNVDLEALTAFAEPFRGVVAAMIVIFGSQAIYAEIKGYLTPSQLALPL